MPITRIVSGGQTGADRGGLAAAIHCRLPHGGWCPKGRRSEDGTIPARYRLQESPSRNYVARTEANVVDSDATIIFSYGKLEGGSLKTAQFAQKHRKPWLHVDLASKLTRPQTVEKIVKWLNQSCPKECVLNVAGQRASKAPQIAGVVKAWMVDVISKVNRLGYYPIAEDDPEEDDDGVRPSEMSPDELKAVMKPLADAVQQQAEAVTLYHPKTIAEAVETVLNVLSPEKRAMIREQSKDDFVSFAHFGLGAGIRNSMIFRNENRIDLLADFQRGCRDGKWQGNAEPDSVSRVIVEQVWERLQGDKT